MALSPAERAALIERVVSAHREVDPRGVLQQSPAFFDLPAEDRAAAFEEALAARALERALDPQGRSTTVRSVLSRLTTPESP